MSKRRKNAFQELLEKYFEVFLPVSAQRSRNTIESYKYAFRLLFMYMYEEKEVPADRITFEMLDFSTLLDFFTWLNATRKNSKATEKQRLAAFSSFADYAQNRDFIAAALFKNALNKISDSTINRIPKTTRAVFTREEVKELLALPNIHSESGYRDLVILSVMYASAMRAQEVCDLTIRDIAFTDTGHAMLTIHGKGSKCRVVGIVGKVSMLLKKYIEHRRICDSPMRHVFSSQTNEHMTYSCIREIFIKYIDEAHKLHPDMFLRDNYSPHSMRHTSATHRLEAGVPLAVLKDVLGHESLLSTQVYTQLSPQAIDRAHRKWNEQWFSKEPAVSEKTNYKGGLPYFLK